jgi:hypothetical protein
VLDRSLRIKNQTSCVLLQHMGTIYFRHFSSRFSLKCFSQSAQISTVHLCHQWTRFSSLYLFGTLEKYWSTSPPTPRSRVRGSLSFVQLQRTVMIFFAILGFRSFGSSLLVSSRTHSHRVHGSLTCVLLDLASQICSRLRSFNVLAPSLFANSRSVFAVDFQFFRHLSIWR